MDVGSDAKLRVIPLGGLGEIGMNLMVYECGEDAIIVDCGMMFPEAITLGIDVIIPDMTYIYENAAKFKAVFLTHAHEDHYGALPFLLERLLIPVYGKPLTIALMREKLTEWDLDVVADLRTLKDHEPVDAGVFKVEAIHVTHSTVDSVAYAIETPLGVIIHSGDFKLDESPLDDKPTDLSRLAVYAERGVVLLLSDSTNILFPGSCPSERAVTQPLSEIVESAPGRVIVTTFSSHLHRIQQVMSIAENRGRSLEIFGRSMLRNTEVAERLGYLRRRRTFVSSLDHARRGVVLVTGSQGEPRSALARAAVNENRKLQLGPGDTVVFSARIIPGFERPIQRLIDNIHRHGADVIAHEHPHVHSSGHAYRDELRDLIVMLRPKYFIPVHGTLRFMIHHARLAHAAGVAEERTLVIVNGSVVEFDGQRCTIAESAVPHGKVFIDSESGQVPELVVRDRRHLATDGFVMPIVVVDRDGNVVRDPDILTRGVLHVDASQDRLSDIRAGLCRLLAESDRAELIDQGVLTEKVRAWTKRYFRKEMGRRPLVVPVVWEM
jgi:ribonuclease J